jgi:tRNA(fMet)-specific endonuclease VapC
MSLERTLDTNVLLAYVRQGRVGVHIEAQYALLTAKPVPIISVVAEGELRALALQFGWGPVRIQAMKELLGYFTVIPLPFQKIVETYAEIDNYSRRSGVAMGKNDIWIAATAHVTGARLLTTDRDFDHLHTVFLERDWVDPTTV